MSRIAITATFLVTSLMLASGAAAQGPRVERVQFDKNSSSKVVKGEIKGRDIIDYQFEASTGQTLHVLMTVAKGGTTSAYFNVSAPGADAALFVGSTSGREFHGAAPATGLYTVRVYIMGNAARQNKSAKFTLEIGAASTAADASAGAAGTWPAKYNASGKVKCSSGKPTLDQQCDFRVIREKGKAKAEIWFASPGHKDKVVYRVLFFNDKVFTTRGPGELSWQPKEDNWWVGIDGKEFYFIPEAGLLGG